MPSSSFSLAIIQKQLFETSSTLVHLLNLLKPLSISTIGCLENLDVELGTFANSLIMLTYHMNSVHSMTLEEGGWGNLRLHILLANADRCFSRLTTIVMNGLRRGGSLKKYVRETIAEAEIRHLRIRLEIYNTALGAPVMLSIVRSIQTTLGPELSTLGFKSISGWADELSHKCIRLSSDNRIPNTNEASSCHSPLPTPSVLQQERSDLIEVVMGMIYWLRNRLSEYSSIPTPGSSTTRDTAPISSTPFKVGQPQPQLQGGAFGPTAPFSTHESHVPPPTAYPYSSTTPGGFSADDIAKIAHAMNGLPLPLPPFFTSSSSSSSAASSPEAHHTSLATPSASQFHPQTFRILEFPTLHLQTPQLTQYELAKTLLLASPPTFGTGMAIPNHPAQRVDRTRALGILSELHKTREIQERDKLALAHLLAQMYMGGGRDIEDLEMAKEYCLEAINGRDEAFGLEDQDTQASILLLSALAAKMGQERAERG